jgi:hypothetical protein
MASTTFKNTAKSKDFSYACKLAKKRGASFDSNTSLWVVETGSAADVAMRQYPEYFTLVSAPADSIFVTDAAGNVDLVH